MLQEKNEYSQHVNNQMSELILQLQANANSGLTVADVEAIVYRIMNTETGQLKASADGVRKDDLAVQVQSTFLDQ